MQQLAWFCHALDTPLGHEIVQEFRDLAAEAGFNVIPEITWASAGEFEEVTLNRIRVWSDGHSTARILYTHTKGAYTVHPMNEAWRMTMASRLIGPWPSRVSELDDVDAVGLHWLTPGDTNRDGSKVAEARYFGGNFWWARADYLLRLPELPKLTAENRWEAEAWIGLGNPRIKDLSPGWPTYL